MHVRMCLNTCVNGGTDHSSRLTAGGRQVTTIAPLLGMTACSYPAMGNWGHAGVHPDRCAAVNHAANPHKVMRKKSMLLFSSKGTCFVHVEGVQVISFICIFT